MYHTGVSRQTRGWGGREGGRERDRERETERGSEREGNREGGGEREREDGPWAVFFRELELGLRAGSYRRSLAGMDLLVRMSLWLECGKKAGGEVGTSTVSLIRIPFSHLLREISLKPKAMCPPL